MCSSMNCGNVFLEVASLLEPSARVIISIRRIMGHLASVYPYKDLLVPDALGVGDILTSYAGKSQTGPTVHA